MEFLGAKYIVGAYQKSQSYQSFCCNLSKVKYKSHGKDRFKLEVEQSFIKANPGRERSYIDSLITKEWKNLPLNKRSYYGVLDKKRCSGLVQFSKVNGEVQISLDGLIGYQAHSKTCIYYEINSRLEATGKGNTEFVRNGRGKKRRRIFGKQPGKSSEQPTRELLIDGDGQSNEQSNASNEQSSEKDEQPNRSNGLSTEVDGRLNAEEEMDQTGESDSTTMSYASIDLNYEADYRPVIKEDEQLDESNERSVKNEEQSKELRGQPIDRELHKNHSMNLSGAFDPTTMLYSGIDLSYENLYREMLITSPEPETKRPPLRMPSPTRKPEIECITIDD